MRSSIWGRFSSFCYFNMETVRRNGNGTRDHCKLYSKPLASWSSPCLRRPRCHSTMVENRRRRHRENSSGTLGNSARLLGKKQKSDVSIERHREKGSTRTPTINITHHGVDRRMPILRNIPKTIDTKQVNIRSCESVEANNEEGSRQNKNQHRFFSKLLEHAIENQ